MPQSRAVLIPAGNKNSRADLILPEHAGGLVVFLSLYNEYSDSASNRKIASIFERKYNLATLLVDLSENQADPGMSHEEILRYIADWTLADSDTAHLATGCFSIGKAVDVAFSFAIRQRVFSALVACDGSFESAMDSLPEIETPVLLISGNNSMIKNTNQTALQKIQSNCSLNVIPHGSHAFSNLRSLEDTAQLAGLWFSEHLRK